jgi:hypothetical protein
VCLLSGTGWIFNYNSMLLLPGQTGEAWEPPTKQSPFGNWRSMDRKVLLVSGRLMKYMRRLRNEELCALYSSPNIVRVIISKRMRKAGHVACMMRGLWRVLMGKREGRRPTGKRMRRWKNNINQDLQSGMEKHGLDSSGLGYGEVAGSCECGNEPSASIQCEEFLD